MKKKNKTKQILVVNILSGDGKEWLGWRLISIDAYKPVNISKNRWEVFDKLEDIVEFFNLKNLKFLDKSNDVDDILWSVEEVVNKYYLADIEEDEYDSEDMGGFLKQLEAFHQDDLKNQ